MLPCAVNKKTVSFERRRELLLVSYLAMNDLS
jgi:hypothetical protein